MQVGFPQPYLKSPLLRHLIVVLISGALDAGNAAALPILHDKLTSGYRTGIERPRLRPYLQKETFLD